MTAAESSRHPASTEAEIAQQHGYHVFNVAISIDPSTGKKVEQYPPSWREASTTNPQILRWIEQAHGYGIDCGASEIVGVDLDVNGKRNGLALWEERGYPTSPLTTDTQAGGQHLYFRADPAHPFTVHSFGELGIDIRGAGGLLYGPGTQVAGGGVYERDGQWTRPADLPIVPWELLAQLREENQRIKRDAAAQRDPGLFGVVSGDAVTQCQAFVDQHFAVLEQSMDGGFNDALNQYCFWVGRLFATWAALGKAGDFSREAAQQYVVDAMNDSDVIAPPDASDMKTITRSTGLRRGLEFPFTDQTDSSALADAWGPMPGKAEPGGETDWKDGPATQESPSEPDDPWTPADVGAFLDGTYEPPKASALHRSDGQPLLYPQRVNWIQGESESGKSWVGQHATAEEINAGHDVAYLDFESNAGEVINRLVLLGCEPDAIKRHLTYINPGPSRIAGGLAVGFRALLDRVLSLVVVDGVTDALGTEGFSMMDNDEVARWVRGVLRPLADRTGAALVCIDHVTKSKDERGRFAIGAQSKMAGLSGVAYVCEVRQQLGVGLTGVVELRVAKDRPGTIRPISVDYRAGDRTAATAVLTFVSAGDGSLTVDVAPATEQREAVSDATVDLPWDPFNPPAIGSVLDDVDSYELASGERFLGRAAVRPLAQWMATEAISGAGRSRAEAVKFMTDSGMASRGATYQAWDRLLEAGALKSAGGGGTGRHLWQGSVDHVPDAWERQT